MRIHAQNTSLEQNKDTGALVLGKLGELAGVAARKILDFINAGEPIYNELAKAGTDTLLGDGARRTSLPDDSGRRLIDRLAEGGTSPIEPGLDGAANYLTLMLNEQTEAWARGVFVELISGLSFAGISAGSIETFAKIEEIIEGALGGQRMVRRVLQPFMNATAILPATWHVNKQYRPELLSVAEAVRQYVRGRWTREQLDEELARQGWSADRIEALIASGTKRLTLEELLYLHFRGHISDAAVVAGARDLGYDEATAAARIEIERAQRRDKFNADLVTEAERAYLAGTLDEIAFRGLVEGALSSHADAQDVISVARARRRLRVKVLSASEERRLVLGGIRSVIDYRRALEREGYDFEAVASLELELRAELDERRDVEAAKAAQAAARLAEHQASAAAKAARDAELAARQALPTITEYRRAYVRGLLTREVYAAALQREKAAISGEDLALLLADADADRERYLEDQARRSAALARDTDPTLTIAQLEAATLRGIFTVPEFDAQLARRELPADDRRVLVALLDAKLADQAAARLERDRAAARAELAGASLPVVERAVRLGVRTRADYAALLESLGVGDVARALVLELLDAQLAIDAEARAKREALEAAGQARGLSLAQRRRAYVAGVVPRTSYEAALVAAGWPVDDQLVELALADLEAEAAAAARARRDQVVGEIGAPTLTLEQLERAVVLGLAAPEELRAYLRARGYGAGDVELLVDLVVARIPDVRAGQALEGRVAGELAAKGVSLADFRAAVLRGVRTLDDYRAMLAGAGYGADAVALLVQLLAERVAVDLTGLRTRVAAQLAKVDDAPALAEIEAALLAGELDVPTFRDVLAMLGVDRDAALVLGRLVVTFRGEG